MFANLKMWIYGAIAAVVGIFAVWFRYRGTKIDRQEEELERRKEELSGMTRYVAEKEKVQKFERENADAAVKASGRKNGGKIDDGAYTL